MQVAKRNKLFIKMMLLQIILVTIACNPTRRVPEGQHLLERNAIKAGNLIDNFKFDKDEVELIIKQKPNRKMLGFIKLNLLAYNISSGNKEYKKKWKRNFKDWLQNTIGEPPVIVDTFLTDKSSQQIKLYLKNKGYFEAKVTDTTIYKKKRAYVTYFIDEGQPYTIRNINYGITDSTLKSDIDQTIHFSNLKTNENFDVDKLDKERDRITKDLKNKGYFYFTKDNINYTADSALNSHQIDLTMKNIDLQAEKDSTASRKVYLKKYVVNQIVVDLNYDPKHIDNLKRDTLLVKGYTFISNGPLSFKTSIILKSIFFQQGDIYRQDDFDNTYQSLSDLKSFRFINIEFTPDYSSSEYFNYINCYIQLLPSSKQNFSISTDGTNSAGQLGINGTFTYQNKNTFKGAEIFEIKLKGGIEAQRLINDTTQTKDINDVVNNTFNTIQIAPSISLTFPKLLLPFRKDFIPKKFKPKTTFSAGYNYQRRPDFTRYIANLSFAYIFKQSEKISHIVTPSEVNFIRNDLSLSTTEAIEGNPRLQRSFADVFITANKYSFIYNGQDFKRNVDFAYFRINVETAGNILRFINHNNLFTSLIPNDTNANGNYQFFGNLQLNQKGNAYAQYSKVDIEYRYFHAINAQNALVSRFFGGIGIPYGNSEFILPFQKSFFAGGANDIRAWRTLQMGPGSYTENSVTYNRIGDIKLAGNTEYRFPIYKYLKGALFVDAGNIWVISPDSNRIGGEFLPDKFYKQIGIGTGIGFRFDFSFFVIRLDFATKIRDPELDDSEAWSFPHLYSRKWREDYINKYHGGINVKNNRYQIGIVNFGIGYPF